MSRIFEVNKNNDIFARDNNRLAVLDNGIQAVLQQCEHAIKARRGEMIYAEQRGIQYLDNIFSGSPNLLLFEAQAREAFLRIDNVISVLEFTSDIVNNTLQYETTIQTTFGVGVINGNV